MIDVVGVGYLSAFRVIARLYVEVFEELVEVWWSLPHPKNDRLRLPNVNY